jgi:hypothetical protein
MTRAWWEYYDDEGPYPGYTPDGPTQFTVSVNAYRRMGLDSMPGIYCRCGFGIDDTKIYACGLDRWRPTEYFCAACMPEEYRWVL